MSDLTLAERDFLTPLLIKELRQGALVRPNSKGREARRERDADAAKQSAYNERTSKLSICGGETGDTIFG